MKIISFEGIEGVGKSTQINMLNDYLKAKGMKTEILREPGSTDIGEKIRDILLNSSDEIADEAELLLMFTSRAQLIKEKVLESNLDFILFDRFYDASIAYQGYGRGLDISFIKSLIDNINCPVPDLTILLDLDPVEGFKRKSSDKMDRIELAGIDFFNNVRKGYLEEASQNPSRIKVIDASQDLTVISKKVLSHADPLL